MNSELKVNYNSISKEYNKRYEANDLSGIYISLEKIISENNYKSILEIGCGTGHWLNKLRNKNRKIFGCDLSTGMLKEADSSKNKIYLFCAKANQLPLHNYKFDMIFCVNALHHFDDKPFFIFDSKKLLNTNGSLCIYGMDPRFNEDKWYIYDFFENTYKNDLKRFPSFDDIQKYFSDADFRNIHFEIAEKVQTIRTAENIFEDTFLRKKGTSQLAMLSENNYKKGIEKIKSAIAENKNKLFKTEITFALISGKNI